MKNIKHFLPLLFIAASFTSCVDTITRVVHQDTIAPEFSVEEEKLKSRISAIIPAEEIYFTSSKTQESGDVEFNTLNVEIIPQEFPSNGFSFSRQADDIRSAVASGISNMDDYQKLKVEVRSTVKENNTEHNRSYKKEIEL